MPKYIVVAGGVISGVGKGIAAASIGRILKEYGYSVTNIKIDPYINCDAGTLRPTEHGEVWVTDDGGEIDQDLGNYERFLGQSVPKRNNITTGQIYKTVIDKERRGEYLGKTVQFIPHIPNEIKQRIREAGTNRDFVIIEIGGTVGDYENLPFLFATKSLERETGKNNVIYFLVTYLLVPRHMQEMKTKPTQQAIKLLAESAGIIPDFILCRAPVPLDEIRRKKIEQTANIFSDHIISAPDIDTIYRIPLNFEKEKLGQKILRKFDMKPQRQPDWTKWKNLVNKITNPSKKVKIAMVGKYVDVGKFTLTDSYISINQALIHAGAELDAEIEIEWIDAKQLEKDEKEIEKLKNYSGILIPGGFGGSGVEGKMKAIKYARENNIPFLGLCYGMQLALVEFARNVCQMKNANTTEVNPETEYPIIDILEAQKEILEKHEYGGTMRLGAYAAILDDKSKVFNLYKETGRLEEDTKRLEKFKEKPEEKFRLGVLNEDENKSKIVLERHRHRYEVSPKFIEKLCEKGIKFSGYHQRADGTKLMEFIEIPEHKYFVATQGHPEFKSRLGDPSPLFYGFVRACLK